MTSVRITAGRARQLNLEYQRSLNFLGSDGLRSTFQEMGKAMAQRWLDVVDSWTPGRAKRLNPSYAHRKQQVYGHVYPILIASGALMASLNSRVLRGPKGEWRIRLFFQGQHPSGIRNQELAEIHINGEGDMPRRDFTNIPEGWWKPWRARIQKRLRSSK